MNRCVVIQLQDVLVKSRGYIMMCAKFLNFILYLFYSWRWQKQATFLCKHKESIGMYTAQTVLECIINTYHKLVGMCNTTCDSVL